MEEQGSKENNAHTKNNKTKNTRMSVEKYPKPCTLQWIEKIELILGNPGGWAEGVGEDRGESGPVTTAGLLPDPARRTQENEE